MQFFCNFLVIWPLLFRALCNKRNVISEINSAIIHRYTFQMVLWPKHKRKIFILIALKAWTAKTSHKRFLSKTWSLVYANMNDRVCKMRNKLSHCYYLKQYPAQLKHEWNWITIQTYFECPYQSNLQFSVSIPTYIRLDT